MFCRSAKLLSNMHIIVSAMYYYLAIREKISQVVGVLYRGKENYGLYNTLCHSYT